MQSRQLRYGLPVTEETLYEVNKNLIELHRQNEVQHEIISSLDIQSENLSKIIDSLNKLLCENKFSFDEEKLSITSKTEKNKKPQFFDSNHEKSNSEIAIPKYPISMRSNVIDPIYAEITNKNKFDNGRKENNNKDGGGFCLSEKVFTLINEKKSKSIKK